MINAEFAEQWAQPGIHHLKTKKPEVVEFAFSPGEHLLIAAPRNDGARKLMDAIGTGHTDITAAATLLHVYAYAQKELGYKLTGRPEVGLRGKVSYIARIALGG